MTLISPGSLSKPSVAISVLVLATWVLFLGWIVVHRLYLSPLSHFPGPKLAALTRWYEVYYEVVLKGQFSFNIDEMHKKYGMQVNVTVRATRQQ